MDKKWSIVVTLLIIFVSSFVLANEKLSNELQPSNEKIKVIVTLEEDFSESKLSMKNSNNNLDEIKLKKGTRNFIYSDGFSTELSYSEIVELSKNPKVKFIGEVRNVNINLIESVSVTNASNSWREQVYGTNLTGKGQTVCILDTGINFSHPDLSVNYLGGYDFVNDDNNSSDDNGHGTHVAGIIAANGSLKGIAPDAGIIAIKVLDENGGGNFADVIAGIEWCVANASLYNISIISMSLGGESFYQSYCDEDPSESATVAAINAAVAQNISVIVSTGNDANYTHLPSPACISNVTPIGATYDASYDRRPEVGWIFACDCFDSPAPLDFVTCFTNRNPLLKLLAPGDLINSTWYDGNYEETGGTSMATPMVAGAFALIKQKLNLTNQFKTPQEIEDILSTTGKIVSDSETGLNFSRINILAALETIEYTPLNLIEISPANNTYTKINETNFSCSAIDEEFYTLENITFFLWNETDLVYNETRNLEGNEDNETFNFTFVNEEEYTWSCLVYNNVSQNYSFGNYSLFYDLTSPEISEVLNSVSYNSATLVWNTSEETNRSIYYSSTLVENNSFSVNHSQILSGLSASTNYLYNLTYCDRAGNCNFTEGSFTTSAAPIVRSSGGGGGGGGSSSKTYELDLKRNETKVLSQGDKIVFNKSGEKHTLTLNKVLNNSANITVQSEPINFILSVGESKKLNLSSSEYFDLEIKLLNVISGKANVSLIEINERIFPDEREVRMHEETSKEDSSDKNLDNSEVKRNWKLVGITLIYLVIILVAFIERKINWKKLKTKTLNEKNEKT